MSTGGAPSRWEDEVGARVGADGGADALPAVLAAAGLPAPDRVEAARGFTNRTWVVATAGGPVVVQRCLRNPSLERLRYQAAVRAHLAGRGLPVPRVVGDVVRTGDGGLWQVSQFLGGDELDAGRPDHLAAAADVLAALHRAGLGPQPAEPPRWTPGEAWLTRPDGVLDEVRRAAAPARPDPAALAEALEGCRGLCRWLAARLPVAAYRRLPAALCHGDFHGSNLRVAGGRVSAVYDFDTIQPGPRARDLADACLQLGRAPRHAGRRPLRPDAVALLLDRYCSAVAVEDAELDGLAALAAMRWLPDPHLVALHAEAGWDVVRWITFGSELAGTARTDLAAAVDRWREGRR